MSDPKIGREVVKAIREYEKSSGTSWRAGSKMPKALDADLAAIVRAPDPTMPHEYQPSDGPGSPCAVCGMAADAMMHQQQNSRATLLKGAPERRGISEFELRAKANGLLEFNGYAAVFDDPYTVTDMLGSFTEVVERNALKRTLSRNPDIVMNVNHSGLPLARSTSGTLRVGTDSHGYYVRADLEPKDPDVDGGDVSIVTTGANRNTVASLRSMIDAFSTDLVECRAELDGITVEELREFRTNVDAFIRERTPRKTMSIRAAERALELD